MCISTLEFPTSCSLFFHSIKNGFEIGVGGKKGWLPSSTKFSASWQSCHQKVVFAKGPETFSWGDDGLFIFLGRKNLFFSPPPPPSWNNMILLYMGPKRLEAATFFLIEKCPFPTSIMPRGGRQLNQITIFFATLFIWGEFYKTWHCNLVFLHCNVEMYAEM